MRKNSSSSLFLMELILAILFFSLASTVCIKLFIQSHLLSKSSVDLNNAVLWCQNLAEAYDGVQGDMSQLENIFSDIIKVNDNTYVLYFDSDWNLIGQDVSVSVYDAEIKQTTLEPLSSCHISCSEIDSNNVIYEIDLKKYIPKEVE